MICEETGCDKFKARGFEVCYEHKAAYRGTGKTIKCRICKKPQKQHKIGYPEHTANVFDMRGPATAAAWARIERKARG